MKKSAAAPEMVRWLLFILLPSSFASSLLRSRRPSATLESHFYTTYTMCGIIGYIGKSQAVPILLDGLRRLEYRGYDSAGVAIFDNGKIETRKRIGRIANLTELIQQSPPTGTSGISHTRWATHGGVSDENAHPHADQSGNLYL